MAIDYQENKLWQHANRFTVYVLELFSRKFWSGGTQIRRASISVSTNITQRLGRDSPDGRELNTARGELWEAHYLIGLAHALGVINESEYKTGIGLAEIANAAIETEQSPAIDDETLQAIAEAPF